MTVTAVATAALVGLTLRRKVLRPSKTEDKRSRRPRTDLKNWRLSRLVVGICPQMAMVSFNGGSENDSPYYKGDIGHDSGQTRLNRVDAFARRQRREQVVDHIKTRCEFLCMMKWLHVYWKERIRSQHTKLNSIWYERATIVPT